MGVAKLSKFDLCPRLRSMRDRKLHVPRGFSVPASIASQTVRDVSIQIIRENWPSLRALPLRSMKAGQARRSCLSDSVPRLVARISTERHGTRSVYDDIPLRLLQRPHFRRGIHRISIAASPCTVAEDYSLRRDSGGARSDPVELGVISGALTLVTNAVMTWNATRLQKAVDAEVALGTARIASIDALRRVLPLAREC